MDNIIQDLAIIADALDAKSFVKEADAVDNVSKVLFNIKKAQYLGFQGYWVQNGRCWQNCYRQKRATSPDKAAQVVWNECWKEYNESIHNDKTDWDKYAGAEGLVKVASDTTKLKTKFASQVQSKVKTGLSLDQAIVASYEEDVKKMSSAVLSSLDHLTLLATRLSKTDPDISQKISTVTDKLTKEAFWGELAGGAVAGLGWAATKAKDGFTNWNNNRKDTKQNSLYEQITNQIYSMIEQEVSRNPQLESNPVLLNAVRARVNAFTKNKVNQIKDPSLKGQLTQMIQNPNTLNQMIQQVAQKYAPQGTPPPGAPVPQPYGLSKEMWDMYQKLPGADKAAKLTALQAELAKIP